MTGIYCLETFGNCSESGFQRGRKTIARRSSTRAVAMNKGQLVAQACSFKITLVTQPGLDFVQVWERSCLFHVVLPIIPFAVLRTTVTNVPLFLIPLQPSPPPL